MRCRHNQACEDTVLRFVKFCVINLAMIAALSVTAVICHQMSPLALPKPTGNGLPYPIGPK